MSLLLIRENHRSSVVLSKYSLSKKDLSLFLQNNTLEHISLSVGISASPIGGRVFTDAKRNEQRGGQGVPREPIRRTPALQTHILS